MIEHQVEQGSAEWFALRIGRPTASEFKKIITPAKGDLSKQARGYAIKLVAEMLLNRPMDDLAGIEAIERGKALEPEAVKMYELSQHKTRQVGFITSDDGRIGASPDRLLIGVNGAVEIKCPYPVTHLEYLLDGFGHDYKPQVQGQMLIGGFDFIDRFSYSPEMPPFLERTYRDEPYIEKMAAALREFCDMKDDMFEKAKAAGWYVEREQVLTPHQLAYSDEDEVEHLVAGLGGENVWSG
jgi:hypothetical protein